MDDPALPPNLAAVIAALRQRVTVLETANRLQSSSIRGGLFRVLDDNGDAVVVIGREDLGGGAEFDGLAVLSPVGLASAWFDSDQGVMRPMIPWPWQRADDAVTVTSGTWVPTWHSTTAIIQSIAVAFNVTVTTDAGTTAELRFMDSATQLGTTKTIPSGTSALYTYWGLHGLVFESSHVLTLQCQRTSGAGNVYVYSPTPVLHGFLTGATTNGWL